MKNFINTGLFKRLICLTAALAAVMVCACSAFASSISIVSSSGRKIEVRDGSVIVERRDFGDRMWSSFILNGIRPEVQNEAKEDIINSEEDKTSETVENDESSGTSDSTEQSVAESAEEFPDYAYEVLSLTNAERAEYGLPELKLNSDLTEVAVEHAADMFENDYFSHDFSNGDSISDRVKGTYSCLGENIASGCTTAEEAVNGWLNSEGHRANILYEDFTELGVGYQDGIWVQVFGG